MIIPYQQLDPDTLVSLIESFVLREGTDYGTEEISLQEKIEQVQLQLRNGTAVIVFSELHETVDIRPLEDTPG